MASRVLEPTQVAQILTMRHQGFSIPYIANRMGVSIRTVYRRLDFNYEPRGRKLQPCGTNAAYQRHKRKNEYPCTPCLEAHAEHNRSNK